MRNIIRKWLGINDNFDTKRIDDFEKQYQDRIDEIVRQSYWIRQSDIDKEIEELKKDDQFIKYLVQKINEYQLK